MVKTGRIAVLARFEWQTAMLIAISYSLWIFLLLSNNTVPTLFWILFSAINIAFFLSITHEVVHGHPTRIPFINRVMVLIPIGWSIPYERFRDGHLEHHSTGELTDPFDDPESWYLAQDDWFTKNRLVQVMLEFNNTLFGRMLIGPVIGLGRFYLSEARALICDTNHQRRYLARVWSLHIALCLAMALMIASLSSNPWWHWLLATYLGHSILLIRTFLEHQAAPDQSQRTVIIEKACPIAFLFLFNNYHFVHHDKPHIPWYRLPAEYRRQRDEYIARNGAYLYRSYAQVFRQYFFCSKEPVAHPFLRNSPAENTVG
ncbi:MAG: fatty acid desaturase [Pseudomonadota bacterium]